MPPSNERYQVKSFPTPLPVDLIFWQTRNSDLPKNGRQTWEYGQPHPDSSRYPNHILVFVTPADDKGLEKCYYAAKRENQDLYNFEHSDADIGGERFETVSRDYVTLRKDFDAETPAMGALMKDEPVGQFASGYVLAARKQGRTDQPELDAMFVVEHLVYVKRSTISEVRYDLQTGRSKYSTSNWYYRGEVVGGSPIEVLAATPGNAYWGRQPSGIFRELSQPTTNWFVVTESRAVPENSVIGPENPAKTRVLTFPTPNGPGRTTPLKTDVLFIERGAMPNPQPEYGSPHYDATAWPDHKLVYVKPADTTGDIYEFYYAANRIDQDLYNFEDLNGESFVRTYVLTRAEYLGGSYYADLKATVGDAIAGRFSQYVFADESVDRSMPELDSLFVIVKRRYLQKTRTRQFYDDDIDSDITEAVTVIEAGTGSSSSSPGTVTEIQPVNIWHDLRITKTVVGFNAVKTLPTLIQDIPYRFPDLLKGARWVGCAAIATSSSAAPSYSESFYIDYDLVEPTTGPYEARVRRFLVANPDSLRSSYPIQTIVTKRETIGQARAYFIASTQGNMTFARAEQLEVPAAIHGIITIENEEIGFAQGQFTNQLPETPGFTEFAGLSEMNVGYESTKTRYGLYVVAVTQINLSGIYNGNKVPFGSGGSGGSGAGDTSTGVVPPLTPDVVMSADNRTITGSTSGLTEVRATLNGVEIGKVQTDASGNFTMPLYSPQLTDSVAVQVTARRSGVASTPRQVFTFDLAPLAPSATVSTDLSTVSGQTEPGARIDILVNGSAQVETATVIANRPQVETLTFAGTITLDGDVQIQFTSAVVTGSPVIVTFPAVTTDTPAQLAEKGRAALSGSAPINAQWIFTTNGADLICTARVTAANDATAEADLTDPNSTGITPATSVNTTAGNTPVTVTTSGNAKISVTSVKLTPPTITVLFAVTSGDTPSQVATKAAAALTASQINDHFIAGSSTNTFSLTSRTLGPNDNSLNIALTNETSAGLIPNTVSADTTPGGTPASVIANGTGAYSYAFSPVLSNGDTLTITATDAGGTSPPTVVTASSTPPTLASAAFPPGNYNTITGNASVGSVVKAYVNDVPLGSGTTSGLGTYSVSLSENLIRGELVRVVATDAGTPTIQSASLYINATDLDLEKPSYEFSEVLGFYGTAPAGATHIKIRNPGGSLTDVPILMPSRNFTFTLPGSNGETYEIFARYTVGDSDPVYETVAVIPLNPPIIEIFDRSRNTVLDTVTEAPSKRWRAPDTSRDGFLMYIAPALGTTLAQTVVSFPGQGDASFVPMSNNYRAYAVGAPKSGGPGIVDSTWRGPMMYEGNAPPGTTNAQLKTILLAELPVVMVVTSTAPDGRTATRVFDRTSYLEQYDNPSPLYG